MKYIFYSVLYQKQISLFLLISNTTIYFPTTIALNRA